MNPRISVIVPCWKSKETIGTCLRHILQELSGIQAEVIVVCNGPDDSSASIAKSFPVKVVELRESGRSRARNYGARLATGEILVFIDSDNFVGPHFFEKILHPFSFSFVHAVEGASIPDEQGSPNKVRKKLRSEQTFETFLCLRMNSPVHPLINTSACAYRKQVFLEVGGFNEELSELEDADLSRKVAQRGGVLYGEPSATSLDITSGGLLAYMARGFVHGRSFYRYQCLWNEVDLPRLPFNRGPILGSYHVMMLVGWLKEKIFSLNKLSAYPVKHETWGFIMFPKRFELIHWPSKMKYAWCDEAALVWQQHMEQDAQDVLTVMLKKLESRRKR